MEGMNPPLLKGAGLSGTHSGPPHYRGRSESSRGGRTELATVRKTARAEWRACRPGDWGLDRVFPGLAPSFQVGPPPLPRSPGKRPGLPRAARQPETPPPGASQRSPHRGPWALGGGGGAAAPEAARPLPPLPPGRGGGRFGEGVPAGGTSPPSRSLPPAHTKTTRADQGACGRASRGSRAHTHAHPQGRPGSGEMDEGTEDKQTVPTGAQLRPGGPGRRRSAAPTAARLPGPGGSWPAAGSGSLRAGAGVGWGSSFARPQPRRLVRSSRALRGPGSAVPAAEPRALRAQPRAARAPPAPPRAPRPRGARLLGPAPGAGPAPSPA